MKEEGRKGEVGMGGMNEGMKRRKKGTCQVGKRERISEWKIKRTRERRNRTRDRFII